MQNKFKQNHNLKKNKDTYYSNCILNIKNLFNKIYGYDFE